MLQELQQVNAYWHEYTSAIGLPENDAKAQYWTDGPAHKRQTLAAVLGYAYSPIRFTTTSPSWKSRLHRVSTSHTTTTRHSFKGDTDAHNAYGAGSSHACTSPGRDSATKTPQQPGTCNQPPRPLPKRGCPHTLGPEHTEAHSAPPARMASLGQIHRCGSYSQSHLWLAAPPASSTCVQARQNGCLQSPRHSLRL